jgi:hypothetical protein
MRRVKATLMVVAMLMLLVTVAAPAIAHNRHRPSNNTRGTSCQVAPTGITLNNILAPFPCGGINNTTNNSTFSNGFNDRDSDTNNTTNNTTTNTANTTTNNASTPVECTIDPTNPNCVTTTNNTNGGSQTTG